MKKEMKLIAAVAAAALLAGCDPESVRSPDGTVAAVVGVDSGRLSYGVALDGRCVLEKSPLGVTVDGRDLGEGVKLGAPKSRSFSETYEFMGNRKTVVNKFKETVWPVLCAKSGKELMKLEVRAFDDGVAYRYRLKDGVPRKIAGEASAWTFPKGATLWYQVGVGSYESPYMSSSVENLPEGKTLCLPITAKLAGGGYVLITEANLYNYTDLAVRPAGARRLAAYFHADKNGFEQSGEAVTPWRVTLVARDLNALANSDIVKNLCPPPIDPSIAQKDFCKPGRCIWQWLPADSPVYSEQHDWYDKTKQLGFEYYLIDDGWRNWRDGDKDQWACLKEAISYGLSIGVKTAIWVHSKEVFNAETRLPYLKRVKECGAVGIKIDFMPPANYRWTQWYEDTRVDCAKVGLFVDFHGAVKPSGRERTWPHELAREAVRGHEWHITRYGRVLPQSHDCILPFCRSVQGRADYTPMVFEPRELVHFTWARELAQGLVFSAPFLCFGDRPGTYLKSPMVEFVKTIPAIYDETICLPGSEIGECAVFAKRSGGTWFLAALNGGTGRTMKVDLSFLGQGKWKMLAFGDGTKRDKWGNGIFAECTKIEKVVSASDSLTLTMRDGGGFAARFTKE